jgi:hypothetical protein
VGGLGAVTGWFGQGIHMEETMFFFLKNAGFMRKMVDLWKTYGSSCVFPLNMWFSIGSLVNSGLSQFNWILRCLAGQS